MTPRHHRMAEADFAALSLGGGGPRVMEALRAARRSRTLLLLKHVADRSAAARPAFELLTELRRAVPAAADQVLDYPTAGEWATRAACRPETTRPQDMVFLPVAVAIRGAVPITVDIPPMERLPLPSLGSLDARLSGKVAVDSLEWTPTRRLVMPDSVSFALDCWADDGPLPERQLRHHVDVELWQERIGAGWTLLTSHHEDIADEVAATISMLTPLLGTSTSSASLTHADAFGCIFLSLPVSPQSAAETLTHELQHNKLVALLDLFTLVEAGSTATFYAPWREDPRPLSGLLHGTYAHLGVAGFWRGEASRTNSTKASEEFARWRESALHAARTLLASGELTDLGRIFVLGMSEILTEWCAEPMPEQAVKQARRVAGLHRARWLAAHGR